MEQLFKTATDRKGHAEALRALAECVERGDVFAFSVSIIGAAKNRDHGPTQESAEWWDPEQPETHDLSKATFIRQLLDKNDRKALYERERIFGMPIFVVVETKKGAPDA